MAVHGVSVSAAYDMLRDVMSGYGYVWHTSVLKDVKLCLAYFCFKRLKVMSSILLF